MFHPILLSIITILFFSAIFYFLSKLRRSDDGESKLNLPPSPPKIPIIGNIHQLGPLLHQSFYHLSSKYGPLMLLNLGKKPVLVVSSAEMATQILKTHDLAFSSRFSTKASKVIFCGGNDIGLAPYGEYWRKVRKFCVLELLSIKRIQSFKFVREEEVDRVVERINLSAREQGTINLTEIMFTMLNTVIFRCSLGDNFNKDYIDNFAGLIKKATTLMESMSFEDFFPSLKWVDIMTGFQGKLMRTSQQLDTFFNQVIDDQLLSESKRGDDKMNFIDLLLLHAEEDNLNLTRDNIKGIIMDMFVGGSDTTATALEWSMAELIKNPKMMIKAQEEVRRVVGNKNKNKVEEQDINQMDYLRCIVKESLRLHPPLPTLIGRISTASAKIGDYDIPTNTGVFINAWAIQRDPKLWDKAEEFCPERFRNNPIDFKGHDFHFIPFGYGRRGCPGIAFGLAVVEFLLANLLYEFNWQLPGGANSEELDMTEGFGITVNRKIPLHVVPTLYDSASS